MSSDEIIGFQETCTGKSYQPAKYALVVFAKGIHVNWKQPIGYIFVHSACAVQDLESMLFDTIRILFEIKLYVRAVVSDAGSNFCKFAKEKGVNQETPYFYVNNKLIYYFFDTPHLIKSARNTFFKYNIHFENYITSKFHLESFYKRDTEMAIRLAPKLTNSHINPSNFEKMKVKYATQVLSCTVAAGISTYMSLGVLPSSATGTITYIERMDKIFDLLNSTTLSISSSKQYIQPFTGKDYQIEFVTDMRKMFANMQIFDNVGNNVTKSIITLKCWQITLSALLLFWRSLEKPTLYTR